MGEKMLTDRGFRIPLLNVVLLLVSLVSFPLANFNLVHAAGPPTAISGTPAGVGGLNTLVNSSPTNLCGAGCVITGGTRSGPNGTGPNLFHSFAQFSVGAGDIATFLNNTGLPTSNILARVTGTAGNNPTLSSIYGTIQTSGFGTANLFLMNPAGFLFGPNATVNVGGMMTFTTADYIRLTDGGRFNANPTTVPPDLLTSAPVAAFGFLNANPAAINFQGGQLTVAGDQNGTGVALIGGNISLMPDASGTPSSITAHGRSIQMTSVAGPGEVAADTGIPSPGMALGTITLMGQGSGGIPTLDTSGDLSFGDGSGGAISIRGGQFVATGATITTSRATGTPGTGGAVTVDVTGSATFTDSTIQTSTAFDFSFVGSGGAVSVSANEGLAMTRTTIDTNAFFSGGDAGSVTLKSINGLVSLTDSTIATFASAPGNGGAVTITGKDVTLTRSGISTDVDLGIFDLTIDPPDLGLVHPGAVTITAQNAVTFSGSPFGDPSNPVISATALGTLLDAGPVTITGKSVNLSNGSIDVKMSAGQIPSPGNSGTIEIHGNNVNLSQFTLRSNNAGLTDSTGKGGNILFQGADNQLAENIQLTNLQIIAASVTGGGAGSIEFQTKALTLNNALVSANSAGIGPAGSVSVHGAQTVDLEANSVLSASAASSGVGSQGPFGAAGSVLLETQQLTMHGGSALIAADLPTSQGNAGSITVRGTGGPAQSILIDGTGTGIFTDAEGSGKGGNISVNANSVTMTNGAAISANSAGKADGGNIDITATNGLSMQNSSITTLVPPSGTGNNAGGGNIKITTSPAATVYLQDSTISASVADGRGGGGNISIDPQFVILQNSQILAQAAQGQGGAITIIAGLFLPDGSSKVNADSGSGQNGTITIQSPIAPASGRILPLPQKPLIATTLLSQRCAALAGGNFSSFTVAGRDSLPAEPGGWLSSPLALAAAGFEGGTVTEAGMQTNFSESVRETPLLSLRQIAPPGFLTQAFAVDWSAGCTS